jgi:opacity protein-like surface antigen
MAQLRIAIITIAALSIGVTAAVAQTRSEPGIFTVARALGTSDARDAELGDGFEVSGTIGRHLTPRIVIEGEMGGGNFAITQPASSHNVNLLFLSVNLDYVWEWGRWSSFVTGGIGAYRYSEKSARGSDAPMSGRDIAPGASVGGGFEYLLARNTAVIVQARYHSVSDVLTVRPLRASFSTVSLGFRRYF